MRINADLSQPAAVHSAELDWVSSPLAGVDRRMLERDGDEIARATSLVRYAPGSSFSAHVHDAGEEFFVLDGIFSDESGDFPSGSYVRNPPGSSHSPFSEPGCIIFVKLRQIPREDQTYVRTNIYESDRWYENHQNQQVLELHQTRWEKVQMLRWSRGFKIVDLQFKQGAEYFVIDGSFSDENGYYRQGSWLRLPPGRSHSPSSEKGCLCYFKTGHLSIPVS